MLKYRYIPSHCRNETMRPTPEPSPRPSQTLHVRMTSARLGEDLYGSSASLASSNYYNLTKNNNVHGSMSSLSSTPRHKKGRAPAAPNISGIASSAESSPLKYSANNSPLHSNRTTPLSRKKRPAPPPPKGQTANETAATTLYLSIQSQLDESLEMAPDSSLASTSTMDNSGFSTDDYYKSIDSKELSEELQEYQSAVRNIVSESSLSTTEASIDLAMKPSSAESQRKIIPIDASLLEAFPPTKSETEDATSEAVVYRRAIVQDKIEDSVIADELELPSTNERQWEKMKENKEVQNKNRQSQVLNSSTSSDLEAVYGANKSTYGKWKRRKGPAPSLPIPPRKVLQMLPLQEIRHELEVIEVQQQGLEKQGVMLEKMIRERCEGGENENTPINEFKPNSKEVEDLILQLFELVNEKNELFRRQAELMYL